MADGTIWGAGYYPVSSKGNDGRLVHTDAWGNITCATSGKCAPLTVSLCDDKNPCTVDSCAAATGCTHANAAQNSACPGGKCVSGECL